jgi:hypothetical protein
MNYLRKSINRNITLSKDNLFLQDDILRDSSLLINQAHSQPIYLSYPTLSHSRACTLSSLPHDTKLTTFSPFVPSHMGCHSLPPFLCFPFTPSSSSLCLYPSSSRPGSADAWHIISTSLAIGRGHAWQLGREAMQEWGWGRGRRSLSLSLVSLLSSDYGRFGGLGLKTRTEVPKRNVAARGGITEVASRQSKSV